MSNQKPTLGYWAMRGVGSQIRYQMVYLGVDYKEDIYHQGEAPEFSRKEWSDKQNSLGLSFPALPYLIDEDVKLTSTEAIMKFICYKYGPHLLGADSKQVGEVEMIFSAIRDIKNLTYEPCYKVTQ